MVNHQHSGIGTEKVSKEITVVKAVINGFFENSEAYSKGSGSKQALIFGNSKLVEDVV